MKKIYLLLYSAFFLFKISFGQGGTWTWISGSKYSADSLGIYGTKGVASVNVHPAADYGVLHWKDKQGNFWIYGGLEYSFSDLWKFNPATKEWTWVNGNHVEGHRPVHKTRAVPDTANTPGTRYFNPATWLDTSGNFWFLGGGNSSVGILNDLWKYDIHTNVWVWMNGDTVGPSKPVYGLQGVADSLNTPGAIENIGSAWTDSLNNLWFFGGEGFNGSAFGNLNDLWKYNISTNEWTWVHGTGAVNQPPHYGVKGVTDSVNDPGGRWNVAQWTDGQGNFVTYGGTLSDNMVYDTSFNDVWKYNFDAGKWTWVEGQNIKNGFGAYTPLCAFDSTGMPTARNAEGQAIDTSGRLWMFGGDGVLGYTNDIWVFDPKILEWDVVDGTIDNNSYGTLGVPSADNKPSPRTGSVEWWGNDNKLYMFGGTNSSVYPAFSDMWVYDPNPQCTLLDGVKVYMDNHSFELYPDPAPDELTIHSPFKGAVTVSIINVLGQEALRPTALHLEREDAAIDVSRLAAGMYFVELKSESGSAVKKFIKK